MITFFPRKFFSNENSFQSDGTVGATRSPSRSGRIPQTVRGGVIYAVGIGVITMCIRLWGAYPEGMSFAILVMNATVPLINRSVKPKRFGAKK